MQEYQKLYIENTKKVKDLAGNQPSEGVSPKEYYTQRMEISKEIYKYRQENTELLRKNLIPLLDDILSASECDIAALEEFGDTLWKGQMDNGLCHQVCGALVVYARVNQKRELLIKELYLTAMTLYNFEIMLETSDEEQFRWKMNMFFGEAAGYIRYYDEIEDAQTRGYIHRSMGNLALVFRDATPKHAKRKLELLRRSLQVLTDPVYHKKTPQLPWDTYIYKTHQERTTLLSFIRSGEASIQDIREVMESAQFVYEVQQKNAKEKGMDMQPQWFYAYHAASYHCGICSLSELFRNLEKMYAAVSPTDYSQQGMYGNVYLPAIYSVYAEKEEGMLEKKKPVILMMYHRMEEYIKKIPSGKLNDKLFFYIRGCLGVYVEYPGENSFRDFIEEMVEGRYPDNHIHSLEVARISQLILEKALQKKPEMLLGVRGYETVEELRAHEEDLQQFIYDCSMLHDIGKMKLLNLYTLPNREWISEEEVLHRYHSRFGYQILKRCESTREYAMAALGHHCWYNGEGGYDKSYHREEVREAALIDIIHIADYIDRRCSLVGNYRGTILNLEEVLKDLQEHSGTKYAPHFVEIVVELGEKLCRD